MRLTPATLSQNLLSVSSFSGLDWSTLVTAISNAVAIWVNTPSNITLLGTATGVITGSGEVRGTLIAPPLPNFAQVASSASGLTGAVAFEMYGAIGIACSISMTGISYLGTSPVVHTGSDSSKVVSVNQPALSELLTNTIRSTFLSTGGTPQVNQSLLSVGISVALAQQIFLATGTGVVTPRVVASTPSGGASPTFSTIG